MLSLPAMAGPWGPARGAPGLTGKCGGGWGNISSLLSGQLAVGEGRSPTQGLGPGLDPTQHRDGGRAGRAEQVAPTALWRRHPPHDTGSHHPSNDSDPLLGARPALGRGLPSRVRGDRCTGTLPRRAWGLAYHSAGSLGSQKEPLIQGHLRKLGLCVLTTACPPEWPVASC